MIRAWTRGGSGQILQPLLLSTSIIRHAQLELRHLISRVVQLKDALFVNVEENINVEAGATSTGHRQLNSLLTSSLLEVYTDGLESLINSSVRCA